MHNNMKTLKFPIFKIIWGFLNAKKEVTRSEIGLFLVSPFRYSKEALIDKKMY